MERVGPLGKGGAMSEWAESLGKGMALSERQGHWDTELFGKGGAISEGWDCQKRVGPGKGRGNNTQHLDEHVGEGAWLHQKGRGQAVVMHRGQGQ